MNVLLINHYEGAPQYGMEYRPYYLAREWIRMGHKVVITSVSFSHLRNKQFEVNRSMNEELIRNYVNNLLKRCPYDK